MTLKTNLRRAPRTGQLLTAWMETADFQSSRISRGTHKVHPRSSIRTNTTPATVSRWRNRRDRTRSQPRTSLTQWEHQDCQTCRCRITCPTSRISSSTSVRTRSMTATTWWCSRSKCPSTAPSTTIRSRSSSVSRTSSPILKRANNQALIARKIKIYSENDDDGRVDTTTTSGPSYEQEWPHPQNSENLSSGNLSTFWRTAIKYYQLIWFHLTKKSLHRYSLDSLLQPPPSWLPFTRLPSSLLVLCNCREVCISWIDARRVHQWVMIHVMEVQETECCCTDPHPAQRIVILMSIITLWARVCAYAVSVNTTICFQINIITFDIDYSRL